MNVWLWTTQLPSPWLQTTTPYQFVQKRLNLLGFFDHVLCFLVFRTQILFAGTLFWKIWVRSSSFHWKPSKFSASTPQKVCIGRLNLSDLVWIFSHRIDSRVKILNQMGNFTSFASLAFWTCSRKIHSELKFNSNSILFHKISILETIILFWNHDISWNSYYKINL